MQAVLRVLLPVALLLGLVLQTPPSATAEATTGSIAGQVVEDGTGWTIQYVQVAAFVHDGSGWTQVFQDSTDSNGLYEIDQLPPDTYRLQVRAALTNHQLEWYADATSVETATDVVVTAGGTVTANASLQRGSAILGRVTDDGAGRGLLDVAAYRQVGGSWEQTGTSGFTDEVGRYEILGLPAGTYRVCTPGDAFSLRACHGGDTIEAATDVVLDTLDTAVDVDIDVDQAAFVTGEVHVWDAVDGRKQLPGAGVTAFRKVGDTWVEAGSVSSRAGVFDYGEYDLGGLPAGTYRLRALPNQNVTEYYLPTYYPDVTDIDDATDIVVSAAGLVEGVTITLQPSVTYTLTQAPTLSGTPQVGKPLTVTPATWTPTPEDITYTWLANGAYTAETSEPVWTPSIKHLGKRISVTATANGFHVPFDEVTSGATAAVVPGPVANRTLPAIGGTPKVGKSLKVSFGQWTPAKVTLKFQWLANGKVIAGATKGGLLLKTAQRGKKVTVRVTASAPDYRSATVVTKPTAKVK